jgi:peptidyl-prolyl cis-trans isomerase C
LLLSVAAAGLLVLQLPARISAEETVAVVNGISITKGQYERRWPAFLKEQGISPGNPDDAANLGELRKKLLENLVGRELLYQKAVREGYGADAAGVEREYGRVCRPFRSEEEVRQALRRSGYTAEAYKDFLRRRLTVEAYLKDRVTSTIRVRQEEVNEVLRERSGDPPAPDTIRARHILIRVPLGASEKMRLAARQEADEVVRLISEGADFDELARRYSDCPSKERGGDLGYLSRGTMSQPFEEAAFGLRPGTTSGVVVTSFGFHVIKVEERQEARRPSPEEEEKRIRESLREEKVRHALEEHIDLLRRQASVRITMEQ